MALPVELPTRADARARARRDRLPRAGKLDFSQAVGRRQSALDLGDEWRRRRRARARLPGPARRIRAGRPHRRARRHRSRAASGAASRSRARSRPNRRFCCSTSRSRGSIPIAVADIQAMIRQLRDRGLGDSDHRPPSARNAGDRRSRLHPQRRQDRGAREPRDDVLGPRRSRASSTSAKAFGCERCSRRAPRHPVAAERLRVDHSRPLSGERARAGRALFGRSAFTLIFVATQLLAIGDS